MSSLTLACNAHYRRRRWLVCQQRHKNVLLVILLHLNFHKPPCAPTGGLEDLSDDQCLHKGGHILAGAVCCILPIELGKLLKGPLRGRPISPLAVQAFGKAGHYVIEGAPAPPVRPLHCGRLNWW